MHVAISRVPPKGWRLAAMAEDGCAYDMNRGDLRVITLVDTELDGKEWIHLSVSRKNRLPSYSELLLVKRLFLGEGRTAYQVFPPTARHINIHPYCLHLWCCLDGDPLPDFARGGNSI